MIVSAESVSASDLRVRITELRRELWDTTQAYQTAKSRNAAEQVSPLLRRKSSLIRELLHVQRALLTTLGQQHESADSEAGPTSGTAEDSVTLLSH